MEWMIRHRFYYVIFGLLFFIFWLLFKIGGMPDIPKALLSAATDVGISMGALLITVEWLLPKFIYQKKYGLFIACFLALLFVAGTAIILSQLRLLGTSVFAYRQNIAKYQEHFFYWFWADLIFGSYLLVFFISSVGAAVRFAFDRIKAMNRIEKLEKENIFAELDLLKSQVNPHFLFNALNTIYYKIDRTNQPARQTLQRFSEMLRYQLYECDKPYIPIEQELDFLRSYIDLQKERLNDNYEITCGGFEEIKGMMIAPFLLLPVVENCFKHISGSVGQTNYMAITCRKEDHSFLLTTCNSIDGEQTKEKGGIGLMNIQKRLQLIYPGKHELLIEKTKTIFQLTLKIELHETELYHRG